MSLFFIRVFKHLLPLNILLSSGSIIMFLMMAPTVKGQLPMNFQQSTPLTALAQPIAMEFIPDGRMLILLKGGGMLICEGPDYQNTATYMTVTNVNSGQERGLIDLTLDPDFATNGYFYIYYSANVPARFRLSRFVHQENGGALTSTGSLASETILWEDTEDHLSCCHYGGGLDFGPDGRIYLSTGDEFDAAQCDDLTRTGGKILRFNSDGTIPESNPFYDGAGPNYDAVWAYGLRNPFRAKWDLVNEQYYIAEVGGNVQSTAREDLHIGVEGATYGWPYCEGLTCSWPGPVPSNYSPAIFDYGHTGSTPAGGSITGGFVYRGSMFPAAMNGAYFYGDYALDFIRYLVMDPTGTAVLSDNTFQPDANGIVELEEGPDGSLFWLDITGAMHRITYDPNNAPICASVSIVPLTGPAPLDVTCNAMVSDNEDDALTYRWIYDDGSADLGDVPDGTGLRAVPTGLHSYGSNGVYDLRLKISDPTHDTWCGPFKVGVGFPPVATITTPIDQSLFVAGDTIAFFGEATDPDGVLGPANFTWEVVFKHNAHVHPEIGPSSGYLTDTLFIPNSGHDFSDNTGYEIRLTVTDVDGLTGHDTVQVWPDKVDLSFTSVPSGMQIVVDGLPYTTPFVKDQVKGFIHTIEANMQCLGGVQYGFANWSDGGASTHSILVPNVDSTYTASFTTTGTCLPIDCGLITSGLVLQLESDLNVSTVSGSDVGGWLDQSGYGNDLSAGGAPQLFSTGGPANMPFLRFDGDDDELNRIGTLTQFPPGGQDRTLFFVVKYNDSDVPAGLSYGNGGDDEAFGVIADSTGVLAVQSGGSGNDLLSTEPGEGAGWLLQSARLSGSTVSHYKDGIPIGSYTHAYGTVLDKLVIGAEIGGPGFAGIDVAGTYLYDRALSDAEHDHMVAYIQTKFFDRSCSSCVVTGIIVGTQSACDGAAVTYDQELIVAYANAPGSGMIQVNGQQFPITGSPQTITLTDLPADGQPVLVTINFTDEPDCLRFYTSLFTAPAPCPELFVDARVFLQGAYDADAGTMVDDMRMADLVPTVEPYTALGYPHISGGGESISASVLATTGNDAIVDWVVLELRDAIDPSVVLATRCSLLQRDGNVVDLDGISPVRYVLPADDYYVSVRHRNHLGAMTAEPVALGNTAAIVDLTSNATATWGIDARGTKAGAFPAEVLWSGDVNFNGVVQYTGDGNDRDEVLQAIGGSLPTNTVNGYLPEDVNLDGTVKYTGENNDRDPILENIGGSLPTSTTLEQLP